MTCVICGSDFTPTNKLNLYCSKTCKNRAAHQALEALADAREAAKTARKGGKET